MQRLIDNYLIVKFIDNAFYNWLFIWMFFCFCFFFKGNIVRILGSFSFSTENNSLISVILHQSTRIIFVLIQNQAFCFYFGKQLSRFWPVFWHDTDQTSNWIITLFCLCIFYTVILKSCPVFEKKGVKIKTYFCLINPLINKINGLIDYNKR